MLNTVSRRARAAAGLGLIVSTLSATTAFASSVPHGRAFEITGYASDWTPAATIDSQASFVTDVGIDGVGVTSSGASVGPPTSRALRLLHAVHHDALRASLLVGNWGGPTGTSPAVARRLLTSPENRVRVASRLAGYVRNQGWNGVTVDLESLASDDGPGLVAFATELKARLPRGALLAVDVAACSSLAQDVAEGYLLPSLAREAKVVLMAYDEHGSWSEPGPIGGLPWVERTVDVARSQLPAGRLVLGIAAYGFEWGPGRRHLGSTSVTVAEARQHAATTRRGPRWDAAMGEWTVRLRNRSVLWWSDSRSIRLRERVAKRLHLGGVAVWQLASADQLPAR